MGKKRHKHRWFVNDVLSGDRVCLKCGKHQILWPELAEAIFTTCEEGHA